MHNDDLAGERTTLKGESRALTLPERDAERTWLMLDATELDGEATLEEPLDADLDAAHRPVTASELYVDDDPSRPGSGRFLAER